MSEVLQLRWLDIQQSIQGGVGGREGFPMGAGASQWVGGVEGRQKLGLLTASCSGGAR